jgi:hypothetical protein
VQFVHSVPETTPLQAFVSEEELENVTNDSSHDEPPSTVTEAHLPLMGMVNKL